MADPLNILGFDFGTKRIGMAYSTQAHILPTILPPIPAQDGIPNWPLIDAQIKRWQAQNLVVGLPFNMDGSINELTHKARKFANRLGDRYNLPCYVVDERLSTFMAKQIHLEQGQKLKRQKTNLDGMAAQLILQTWHTETTHQLANQPLKPLNLLE